MDGQLALTEALVRVKACREYITERGASLYLGLFFFCMISASVMKRKYAQGRLVSCTRTSIRPTECKLISLFLLSLFSTLLTSAHGGSAFPERARPDWRPARRGIGPPFGLASLPHRLTCTYFLQASASRSLHAHTSFCLYTTWYTILHDNERSRLPRAPITKLLPPRIRYCSLLCLASPSIPLSTPRWGAHSVASSPSVSTFSCSPHRAPPNDGWAPLYER
jgi:hypothetical protein